MHLRSIEESTLICHFSSICVDMLPQPVSRLSLPWKITWHRWQGRRDLSGFSTEQRGTKYKKSFRLFFKGDADRYVSPLHDIPIR